MRTDQFLVRMRDLIQTHPKPEGQADEVRALFILSVLIAELDEAHAKEMRIREEQSKAHPGYYLVHEVKTAQDHLIQRPHFGAFCEKHKLDPSKLLSVAMGESKEYAGYARGRSPAVVHALGHPYKESLPRHVEGELARRKKDALDHQKAVQKRNEQTYTAPPPITTVTFNPNN